MKKLTKDDFIQRSLEVHNRKYSYNKVDYTNNYTKVKITCPDHGVFEQTPVHHLRGQKCPVCSMEQRSMSRTSTVEQFINKAVETHGDKYDYSKVVYTDSQSKVKIECKLHGQFEQVANNHLNGKGCPKCGQITTGAASKTTREEFVEKAKEIHGDLYDYSIAEYVGSHIKTNIICKEHGEFPQTPSNHLKGTGCPQCKSISKGEKLIGSILRKNHIEFKTEYVIPDSKPRFRYDFYLPDRNLFIEFHGIQHYKPVSHFGGEEGYKQVRERDILKAGLARMARIPIVYFNYSDLKLDKKEFERILLLKIRR